MREAAFEALPNEAAIAELAAKYRLHRNQIYALEEIFSESCSPLLAGIRPNLERAASPPLPRIEGAAAAVAFLSR